MHAKVALKIVFFSYVMIFVLVYRYIMGCVAILNQISEIETKTRNRDTMFKVQTTIQSTNSMNHHQFSINNELQFLDSNLLQNSSFIF